MRLFAHDRFTYPLPEGHRFPRARYRMLRQILEADSRFSVQEAEGVTDDDLLLAHGPHYLGRVVGGRLTQRERRAVGLPWSPELVERGRRSVGATVAACRAALQDGVAVNLGGGTHHAFPDSGRGYCTFNDSVVAVRRLRADGLIRRVLIVDLDVHQGDGTHTALGPDPGAVCMSVNGGANHPVRRVPGDVEENLPDRSGDDRYLDTVGRLLRRALRSAHPDLCIYLAGADPYEHDRLGRLSVTMGGLGERDLLVRSALDAAGIPVCVTLAGGYAERIEDTVAINVTTVSSFAR